MSIWIAKTVNKEEKYVKLVCHVTITSELFSLKHHDGVLLERMHGDRLVMPVAEFYRTHDRTEHVDFMEAYYGQ